MNPKSDALSSVAAADVADYLYRFRLTHINMLITGTFLVWDIVLTFDREYHYIWKSRWSFAKIIFLLNRYLVPLKMWYGFYAKVFIPESLNVCKIHREISTPTTTPLMFIINVVIMARTYAIYNCRPKVLYTLIISYLACFVPTWAYYYSTAHNLLTKKDSRTMETIKQVGNAMGAVGGETSAEAWILRTCYSTGVPKQLGAVLASGLIFESGLFLAMMWQLYRKGTTPRMMRRFYFDGMAYYCLMFVCYSAAIVGCLASGEARAIVASRFHLGFKSMLCSHMILHLRAYFMTPISFPSDLDDSKSYPQLATGTAIHFASPDAVSHSSSEGEGYGDGVAEMGVLSLGRTRSQGVVTFADIALDRRATREQDWTNSPAPYLRGTSVVVALPLQDRSGPRC